MSLFRLCDSRNLNLSPFCTLTTSSLVKWQPTINKIYGNINTSYTSGLPGPMRPRYPKYMADKELLSSLAEVDDLVILNYLYLHLKTNLGPINTAKNQFLQKGNPEYNVYEKDIAVVNLYFGDSTVFGIYVFLLLQII